MTNDIEAAARAYLAAYDVESSNSEMWYRAVVDARDALRAALAEATEPATKPEGCPCVCCANRAGMLRAGRTDLRGACYCGMVEDEERCDCAFCLSPTKLVSCSETATPPAPAEGRGEEDGSRGCIVRFCDDHAEVEIVPGPFCPVCSMALVLRDGVKLGRDARSIPHGDGGGKGAK